MKSLKTVLLITLLACFSAKSHAVVESDSFLPEKVCFFGSCMILRSGGGGAGKRPPQ
jgi:hypothetical protein